jgi:hypothetical protein
MVAREKKDIWHRIRDVALNNLWLKIISILIAFTLWFIVTGGPRREATISVGIDLERYIPENWAPVYYDNQVQVKVRGREEEITAILTAEGTNSKVSITFDQNQIQGAAEEQVVPLNASNVSLPFGVQVLEISPQSIRIQLDRKITRKVNVNLRISGEPLDGFVLAQEPELLDPTIDVTGARQLVDEIQLFADLSLDGRGRTNRPVNADLIMSQLLNYNPQYVRVHLVIIEETKEKQFSLDASYFEYRRPEENLKVAIDPGTVILKVTGPAGKIDELTALEQQGQKALSIRIEAGDMPEDYQTGRRARVVFRPEMVIFRVRPPSPPEKFETSLDPNEFYVIISSNEETGGR